MMRPSIKRTSEPYVVPVCVAGTILFEWLPAELEDARLRHAGMTRLAAIVLRRLLYCVSQRRLKVGEFELEAKLLEASGHFALAGK